MTQPEEIHVLNKRLRLLQPADGFRTSLDSVMLAAACPAGAGDHILDLGCGVGGAGFCVLTRVAGTKLTGVDIQGDHIDLARQNAALNDMNARADFVHADILELSSSRQKPGSSSLMEKDSGLRRNDGKLFNHVICNPPYLEAGHYTPSPQTKKATALGHTGQDTALKDWIDCGFRHLKSGGSFTIIHRADQIDKILQGFGKRFGAVEIIPLWPRAGEAAKRVIIRALKDRKSPALLQAGIVLHQEDGEYTAEANEILRDAKSIPSSSQRKLGSSS